MKQFTPPLKSQGIKTRLTDWIRETIPGSISGRWIEPFMGTGVVGFSLADDFPELVMADSNPHVIRFYDSLANRTITGGGVREYLEREGRRLANQGESVFYEIRERFNRLGDPLDFLFLNRACFNGIIRFNRKGEFNVPFCRKPNRFASAYITKIVHQIEAAAKILKSRPISFACQSFEETIAGATKQDLIYCDPPYIARHADYYNGWTEDSERKLFDCLDSSPAPFIVSTWFGNQYRTNPYLTTIWSKYTILSREHFYFVGGHESNRGSMTEALIVKR